MTDAWNDNLELGSYQASAIIESESIGLQTLKTDARAYQKRFDL